MSKASQPSNSNSAMALKPVTTHGLVYLKVAVPFELRDAVESHHRNLNILAQQLRQAGASEDEATAHLNIAIASYREALQTAATSIRSSNR